MEAPSVSNLIHSIIFFQTTNTGTPSFSVRINNQPVLRRSFTSSEPRCWHEIIMAGALKEERNELIFAVSGAGTVRFSGVVILYTASKTTVRKPKELIRD